MNLDTNEPTNRHLGETFGQLINVLLVSATLVVVLKVVSLFWFLGAKILGGLILLAAVLDALKNSLGTIAILFKDTELFTSRRGMAFLVLGLLHDFLPVAILVWAVRWLGLFISANAIYVSIQRAC